MPCADINHVVLVGRLTRDPQLRALPSGTTACGLHIACNTVLKDGDVYKERPHYFDVIVFGALGEDAERDLRKGFRAAVAGRLDWREWETDGQKFQAVFIVANSVQPLDAPADSQHGERESDSPLDERQRR